MYHVKITDDSGRTVSESDGDALMLIHHENEMDGVRCITLSDGASTSALFEIILAMDKARGDLMDHNPILKLAYALRDDLVDERTEIDLTRLWESIE